MKRSSRMRTLLRIEEAKEHEEARRFAEQRRLLREKNLKLTELRGYLGEYKDRFANLTRAGAHAAQIRSSYAFIGQLGDAISQQEKVVSDAERSVEEYRQQWLEAKRRVDILQKTMERMRREETERKQRTEQSLADEAAGRKHHRS